eukprot:1186635-Prorocentrum_minimum.AAC.1
MSIKLTTAHLYVQERVGIVTTAHRGQQVSEGYCEGDVIGVGWCFAGNVHLPSKVFSCIFPRTAFTFFACLGDGSSVINKALVKYFIKTVPGAVKVPFAGSLFGVRLGVVRRGDKGEPVASPGFTLSSRFLDVVSSAAAPCTPARDGEEERMRCFSANLTVTSSWSPSSYVTADTKRTQDDQGQQAIASSDLHDLDKRTVVETCSYEVFEFHCVTLSEKGCQPLLRPSHEGGFRHHELDMSF